jgi:cell division protein FtsL
MRLSWAGCAMLGCTATEVSIFTIMSKTLTYEQMMALFAEGHKETAELRSSIAEQGKRIDDLGSRIDDLRVIVDKNNERLDKISVDMQRNNERLDKISVDLKSTTQEMGNLTNKLGGIVESIVIPGIVGKFNEKGFSFDSVSTNVKFLSEGKRGKLAEVDALLENGKFVIAVEAKTDMQVSHVNEHIKRLNLLRSIPRFKGKKIYGAFSTAIARKKPVDYALEKGFYVLQQPDVMGVKILDFPKGHHAKAW